VEETLVSGVYVATVARAHALNANQLFQWRKLYKAGVLGNMVGRPRMLPVTVGEEPSEAPATDLAAVEPRMLAELSEQPCPGLIELTHAKMHVRIAGTVDPAALRVVLECLLG